RSTNQGTAWTPMDLAGDPIKSVNPGEQGPGNDDIVADPTDPNVVFIAGDQSFLFRGDASQAAGKQWTSITGQAQKDANGKVIAGANGTVPHADSRSMTF